MLLPQSVDSALQTTHKIVQCQNSQEQRLNKKGEENSGRGKAKPQGRQNKREEIACNISCRDLGEDKWVPGNTGKDRGPEKVRHTSITETNRLPSALVVVPSLSKLKNKGRDNREQLVKKTFKKLKKQNVISY
jgi:hypothetical protein